MNSILIVQLVAPPTLHAFTTGQTHGGVIGWLLRLFVIRRIRVLLCDFPRTTKVGVIAIGCTMANHAWITGRQFEVVLAAFLANRTGIVFVITCPLDVS